MISDHIVGQGVQNKPDDAPPTEPQLTLLRRRLGDKFVMPASKAAASALISSMTVSAASVAQDKPATAAQLKYILGLLQGLNKGTAQVRHALCDSHIAIELQLAKRLGLSCLCSTYRSRIFKLLLIRAAHYVAPAFARFDALASMIFCTFISIFMFWPVVVFGLTCLLGALHFSNFFFQILIYLLPTNPRPFLIM